MQFWHFPFCGEACLFTKSIKRPTSWSLSIKFNGCAYLSSTPSLSYFGDKMADNKENMSAVTHQLSAVDDDIRKGGSVQEKTVASVALGMSPAFL